jgi:hypothetical protein
MRKRREEELKTYEKICSVIGCESNFLKWKHALILEYPFKTDAFSVNEARLKATKIEENDKHQGPKSLENFVREYMRLMDNPTGAKEKSDLNVDRLYQQQKIENMLDETWPMVRVIDFDSEGRKEEGALKKVPLEDIVCAAPGEALHQNIDRLLLRASSKKVYHTYARRLVSHVRNRKKEVGIGSCKRGISIEGLSSYFEYLESRCLKSCSDRPYRNLLEIRLLFYVPLPTTQLGKMTLSSIKTEVIEVETESGKIHLFKHFFEYGNQKYPVPATFIEFAKALLSENEPLLSRDGKIPFQIEAGKNMV